MIRSLFTVGGFTLLSRILGFIRDKLVVQYLGDGAAADAWTAAFRFPNLFRRVFGEGAFNAAFVPLYSRRLEGEGEAVADALARRVLSVMAVLLTVICVLCFIFMGPVVRLTNPGYDGERFELAVGLSRITVPYLVLICLTAALAGVLNGRRVFGPPAFVYSLLNIVFLIGLIFVLPRSGSSAEQVLAWSLVVAGVLQFGWLLAASWRRGIAIRPTLPRVDEDVKRLGVLMGPGLISAGVQQLNLVVGGAVASFQEGGQTYIYIADRVNQLPLGLIGMAFGVVLLPELARRMRSGDEAGARSGLARGIELSLLIALPAAAALCGLSQEIIAGIFKDGAFDAEASQQAGYALLGFAVGTPAYILIRVLQPGYFAREDTRTPMRFTIVASVVNMILCVALFFPLRHVGCALATSIAGWLNVWLLWRGLRREGLLQLQAGFASRLLRVLLGSIVMTLVVIGLAHLLAPWIFDGGLAVRLMALGAVVGVGIALYGVLMLALRVTSVAELKRELLRRG